MKKIFIILFFLVMFNFTNAGSIETTFVNKAQVEKNKMLDDGDFANLPKEEKIIFLKKRISEIKRIIERILLQKVQELKEEKALIEDGKNLADNYKFETRLTKDNLFVDVYDKRNGNKIQTIKESRECKNYTRNSKTLEYCLFSSLSYGDEYYSRQDKEINDSEILDDIEIVRTGTKTKNFDFNFDGIKDIFIYSGSSIAGNIARYGNYYIFSQKDKKFIRIKELDGKDVYKIEVNKEKKRIYVRGNGGPEFYIRQVLSYDKNAKKIEEINFYDDIEKKDYYLGKTFDGYTNIGGSYWIKDNEIFFAYTGVNILLSGEYLKKLDINVKKYKIISEYNFSAIYDDKFFYIDNHLIEKLNPKKVEYLGNKYFRYENNIYYNNIGIGDSEDGSKINTRKAEKFKLLNYDYATDEENIFFKGEKINDNYECFKELKFLKDKDGNESGYAKDCENIYYEHEKVPRDYGLKGDYSDYIDYDTFVVDKDGWAYDNKHQFHHGFLEKK